jgi:polar amino acid transport system substrate-binding protein
MLKLFSSTVLLLVLGLVVLLVIVGHIIWLVERRRNDHFPKAYAAGVWEGIWWAIVTMSTVGYGDRTVSTRTGRLIAMAWMLVGLVLVAQFTAIITSTLTVDRIYSDIRGVQDLYGKDVVTVSDTTAARFLDAQGIPARRVATIDEAFDAVRSGSAAAVVYDSPVLRYYAATEGAGEVEVVGPLVQPQGYGMAFPEGSPLVPPLNLEFLKLREDGTAQELDDRYFGP